MDEFEPSRPVLERTTEGDFFRLDISALLGYQKPLEHYILSGNEIEKLARILDMARAA